MRAGELFRSHIDPDQPGIWRYRRLMDVQPEVLPVSLGEGATPLVPLRDQEWLKGSQIALKNEAANPTWSHKDRLASMGVSIAKARGADTVVVASTGNQGAAAAAYCAAAGI